VTYKKFLEYIYKRHSGNVKLGLDRIHAILQAMDNPNQKLTGIHIAGTNGKGSTAAICEAILLEHGLSTGLNTSPHLIDYRERIRLNGKNIKLDELMQTYKKWENTFEKYEASFFEITTAMAFWQFYNNQVDASIFEVGLGGRLDGTRPFQSTVTVITSISYDHTKSLGDTIEKIAFEKAGILKNNTPLVLGNIPQNALQVILKKTEKKDIPVQQVNKDFQVSNIEVDNRGTHFDFEDKDGSYENIYVNLIGKHQACNAALAITACKIYLEKRNITPQIEKIRRGLSKVNWPGRMQILQQKPMVIIDGAHNEEGVKVLTSNLRSLFPNRKIYFVLAILRDKNLKVIIANICQVSAKIFIAKNNSQRAAELEEQEKYVKQHKVPYQKIEDVVEATRTAIRQANNDDVVMISGSLYTISEVLKHKKELF
jgi:dihydrofolate synthase/folylpolyglutamate synthase